MGRQNRAEIGSEIFGIVYNEDDIIVIKELSKKNAISKTDRIAERDDGRQTHNDMGIQRCS